jgi:hypothetical protein
MFLRSVILSAAKDPYKYAVPQQTSCQPTGSAHKKAAPTQQSLADMSAAHDL